MPPRRKSAPAGRVYKSAVPLQQAKLPRLEKRVKSYGKKTTRMAKQDTLTQIGFVQRNGLHEEDEEESDYEEASKKRKKKRRKTAGDPPSESAQWHTQTISQMLDRSFSSNDNVEEEVGEDRSIFDMPSSSQSLHLPTNIRRLSEPANTGPSKREQSPILGMPPPQTPRRDLPHEIPSSQSPITPLSVASRGSARQRSPLKEKPINIPIPFYTTRRPQPSSKDLPKLKIEDTFDSGNNSSLVENAPSSSIRRPSPAKSVRFALPEEEEDIETPRTPSIKKESTPYPTQYRSNEQPSKFEISDSDAEDEGDLEEVGQVEGREASAELDSNQPGRTASILYEQDDQQPETYYGDIGRETQLEADRIVSSTATEGEAEQTANGATQLGETQRVSTQHVISMSPRTDNSDIFISIHPQHVVNIVNRTKNHEMRNWAFPASTRRIWIYETKPVSALKYMAEISPPKRPGEIVDEGGLGNADFNGKLREGSWNAYEILQLYELVDPIALSTIISNGWMKAAPQRFAWVRPAVADELIANLRPPFFNHDAEEGPTSSSTDTQEAAEQLLSTIRQFTQPSLSSEPASSQAIEAKTETMQPPSSLPYQETTKRPSSPPRASQAETVDLTQAQTPRHPSQEVDIVWESPARPVLSSTPLKLPTPRSEVSEHHGHEFIVPFSMSSSQFLSRSQLLPHSLLNEDVPGPPRFIHDSDDNDDDDEL
ncbi:hypothetical protein EG329_011283 [Mollisiaceae sp. DMI_Dod_QoI]|nr:hypothetical protein EG329_011283 [Helotiales sp. DMI_Dod_QoI]